MKKIGSGKVREIYEVSDKELVIYTTDRVSAFDVVLPTPVPQKGMVLNKLSQFWFQLTEDIVPNHVVSFDVTRYTLSTMRVSSSLGSSIVRSG